MVDELLSKAIVAWTGFETSRTPSREERRVVERLGADVAVELMPRVRELEDDFYASNARWVASDLVDMGNRATADFREKHPEISTEAVEAFAWCYTYDYK